MTHEVREHIAMNNNLFDLINKIQNFKGDPNQMLNQLLSSGRFSKEQIEEAKQKASKLESALNVLGFRGR